MFKDTFGCFLFAAVVMFVLSGRAGGSGIKGEAVFQPLPEDLAAQKADSVLAQMTPDEKIAYVGGDRNFFIRPMPRLNLSEVYMSDATQGIHIRETSGDFNLSKWQPEKSTAFPCPVLLAATWNPDLSRRYARAVGEECRAAGIGVLLGPGMNIYRHSQCGRNFEYFGEDPFLAGRMIASYVQGVQSTGTVATLKHFVANNTDYYRRKSNSVVSLRALHEIYTRAFKAGIDAGARAVMTSYNLLNGEWCGQSRTVIHDLLRHQLGFRWLVMTDWWSVHDGEELAASGQDLEMPHAVALDSAQQLVAAGKVSPADIDRMAGSILKTCFSMRLYDREKDPSYMEPFANHEAVALETARQGIVLLKNEDRILPVQDHVNTILLTGDYVTTLARGGGSAAVEGYNHKILLDALKSRFGSRLIHAEHPAPEQIRSADLVLCVTGTSDSEGWDRPFALPDSCEKRVRQCTDNNPNTVVIVASGGGVRMTDWAGRAKGIVYAWYGGQNGNEALAEIIAGEVNPSGRLPITIEREFSDSPGYGYIPGGETLYTGWRNEEESQRDVYDVNYREGVFVGYRWYEKKKIKPLFPFGHGLSYTTFDYSGLQVSADSFRQGDTVTVSFDVQNTGLKTGMETVQLYVQDVECTLPRPVKELKGFRKITLSPGRKQRVSIGLTTMDFSFWSPETKNWKAEPGTFIIHVGASSGDIRLKREITLL